MFGLRRLLLQSFLVIKMPELTIFFVKKGIFKNVDYFKIHIIFGGF